MRGLGLCCILFVAVWPAMALAKDAPPSYYFGADLSYVNELEDCGAVYRSGGHEVDVFELLHSRGANLVRVRLWNDAQWTRYSNLTDVKKTIRRARRAGMQVLLDFHYSDDWADGDKQVVPKAWARIESTDELAAALYDFTYRTLRQLDEAGLMPEMVQVGNETNGAILSTLERAKEPIEWGRNAKLFNAGIRAVRDAGAGAAIKPRVMLHVAQPENVEPWFAAATAAGVTDFDLIGISYYKRWSSERVDGLAAVINRLRHRYAADVLLVEAAYPWTLDNADSSPNLLGADTLLAGYPATPDGQRRYLIDLTQRVIASGGVGLVYWEPAWISSKCRTRWGSGSGWDNAALFDFRGELLPGADYLDFPYIYPVDVEITVDMAALGTNTAPYLWGDFLGKDAAPVQMSLAGKLARFTTRLMPGTPVRIQLYRSPERREPLLYGENAEAVVGVQRTTLDLSSYAGDCDTCGSAPVPTQVAGNFNNGWQFHRFAAPEDPANATHVPAEQWEAVTLPHTARIEPRLVNDQWQGIAFYRKSFRAEPAWRGKRVWLRFEAAMNIARVSLNGRELATHFGGYLPFVVDLGPALRFDASNELTVRLDNRDNAITGPKALHVLDFNMYGGLYRDVTLIVKEPLHITDELRAGRPAGGGIFVTYPQVSRERATVAVKTHVRNDGRSASNFRVTQTLWSRSRRVASASSTPSRLAPRSDIDVHVEIGVERPELWSPRSPALYDLVSTVELDGRVVDERRTRIGIRRIEIAPGSFKINGEQMFLRGVNRHQEYPYVGYALSRAAEYRDARRIKEAGFDLVRLSHYPQSPHFMAAADELGLVLLNPVLGWQFYNDDPRFERQVLQTCRDLVRRDRNHPSVVLWECSLNESRMPLPLVRKFQSIVHEEYPGEQVYSAGWQNDGYDVYIQARQHRLEHYEPPDRPYLVSEYGDWEYYALNAGFQQHAWANLQPEARTSRQLLSAGEARLLQQATNMQEAHNDNFATPAFADAYWAMFDYNRGYAEDLEASGVMSLDRVAKFGYRFFRSQRDAGEVSPRFAAGPEVFIANNWQPDSTTEVRVFGNVEEVELFLNGRRVERRRPDSNRMSTHLRHPPFTFKLNAFERGSLEAVGYIDGRSVALHRVITPETVERIELALDDAGVCPDTQRSDLVFVRARLLDRNGTVVPVSGQQIDFTAGGSAELVGPAALATEAGVASALLRMTAARGEASIAAKTAALGRSIQLDPRSRNQCHPPD